jgi:hypothetical protein
MMMQVEQCFLRIIRLYSLELSFVDQRGLQITNVMVLLYDESDGSRSQGLSHALTLSLWNLPSGRPVMTFPAKDDPRVGPKRRCPPRCSGKAKCRGKISSAPGGFPVDQLRRPSARCWTAQSCALSRSRKVG